MYTITFINEKQEYITKNVETIMEIIECCERFGIEKAYDQNGLDITQAIRQILVDRFPW